MSTQVEGKHVQCLWTIDSSTHFFYFKIRFQGFQELLFSHSIQILHHTVIIHDMQLIVWETYCQKVVILLITTVIWILQLLLMSHQCRGCTTMMTICYIHRWHRRHNLRDTSYILLITNHPKCMTKAIQIRYKVIFWCSLAHASNDGIQLFVMRVCKEYRLYVRIVHTHMLHAVFFLVTTSQLMLLDATFHIVFHPCCYHQAVLGATIHRLSIYIVLLLLILHQPSFLTEQVKLLTSCCIYALIMFVCTFWKIDFRFDNVV